MLLCWLVLQTSIYIALECIKSVISLQAMIDEGLWLFRQFTNETKAAKPSRKLGVTRKKSVHQIVLFKVLCFTIFHFSLVTARFLSGCFTLQSKPCSCRLGPSCTCRFLSTIQMKGPIANLPVTVTTHIFYISLFCNDFEKKKC